MSALTVNDLPFEILSHTLRLAVLPEYMLDHSLSRGPSSGWCRNLRAKKVILMVCKIWNEAALPMLYRDIIIRRFGQFLAVSKALEENPVRLSRIVRSIAVEGFVDRIFFDLFSERLEVIYQICPGLSTLSCLFILPREKDIIRIPAHRSITNLSLCGPAHYSPDILRLLCSTLVSLATPAELSLTEPGLRFPKLKALYCFTGTEPSSAFGGWEMPSLDDLTLNISMCAFTSVVTSICANHGGKLKTLRLLSSYSTEIQDSLQGILDFCPNLDYLHVPLPGRLLPGTTTTFSHPCLTRIDLGTSCHWSPRGPQKNAVRPIGHKFGASNWDCPKLNSVRLVSNDLDYVHDPQTLVRVISQLDFQPPPDNPVAGVSFENICICHVSFNGRQVQWIHPLRDHSDYSPRNYGHSLPLPDSDSDEDETSPYHTSDDTSSAHASANEEDPGVSSQWAPDLEQALELFEDTLAHDSSDSDSERHHWQEFVDPPYYDTSVTESTVS